MGKVRMTLMIRTITTERKRTIEIAAMWVVAPIMMMIVVIAEATTLAWRMKIVMLARIVKGSK